MPLKDEISIKEAFGALDAEAQRLAEADENLKSAQTRFDLAVRKFVSVREMAEEYAGEWPYLEGTPYWPNSFPAGERFRFARMPIGDAILAALKELKGQPRTPREIMIHLRKGGGFIPGGLDLRSITASITRLNRVEEVDGDKYRLKEDDPDDLPFE